MGVLGAECPTGALLNRLTHHVYILEINGENDRQATSTRRARKNTSIALVARLAVTEEVLDGMKGKTEPEIGVL